MISRRAFAALAFALSLPLSFSGANAAEPLPDMVMGSEDAPVTVVEYASMTCPHCANFHSTTFKELKTEYIDTGKVKFVLREFPFDPLAAAVFMLARCSDDKYYDVVDLYFEHQREWAVQEDALPKIRGLARQAGFSDDDFQACLTDQKLLDGINAVKDKGYEEMGVRATPTIFVDGEKLEGSRDMRALRDAIDPKLDS
ncbi:DsbA family protein [Acuticoccus sp. MNP-M23]|uniref:DsbA family protein n=1 Tax=Acuticoccus sp. MNP-M23 TaxID=3072793 RepID=UPI002814E6E4|nr:DsbA family protein [Acuticoccus sp. MNP-M23]WMS43363.1 DsbA family protein [Acuticoccus sp. MNP-M23]